MSNGNGVFATLESWKSTLIIIAGILTTITAALSAYGIVSDVTTNPFELAIAPFAFLLLFLGVFGLYPRLVERTPRLTRTGAGFGVLALVFAPILGIVALADLAGVLSGDIPVWALGLHLLGRLVGMIALILFSTTVLRTAAFSRRVGYLLLGPAAIMFLSFVHIAIGAPQWTAPPLVAANGLLMMALGYTLRTERVPAERSPSATDTPG